MNNDALIARARQAVGLDHYTRSRLPDAMDAVAEVLLDEVDSGARFVGVRFVGDGTRMSLDVLTDDEVVLRCRYRIGGIGDPVERDLPADEIWRLAVMPGAVILDIRDSLPSTWFIAGGSVRADGVLYVLEVEDSTGLGGIVWQAEHAGILRAILRAARRSGGEDRDRARRALAELNRRNGEQAPAGLASRVMDHASVTEATAIVGTLATIDAGSPDNGLPPVRWCLMASSGAGFARVIAADEWTADVSRSRLGRIASRTLDELCREAFGATHPHYEKAQHWGGLPAGDEPTPEKPGGIPDVQPMTIYPPTRLPWDWNGLRPRPDFPEWEHDHTADEVAKHLDRENDQRLRAALTERQYEIFRLHLEKWSSGSIAARCGVTPSTVDNTIAACRRKLRDEFSQNTW